MKEHPWLKSYDPGVPHSLQPYPKIGPVDLLTDTVKQNPNHTMIIYQDRRISWEEVDRASDELAAALVSGGNERTMLATPYGRASVDRGTGQNIWRFKKGDRVALLFLNCPQSHIAFYAIWKAGGIVVPLNPLYTPYELERSLNEVGAEVAIVLSFWYPTLKSFQARTKLRLIIASEMDEYALPENKSASHSIKLENGDLWWGDLMSRYAGSKRPDVKVNHDDTATILFSGGTTGTPKGVMGSHHSFGVCAIQLQSWWAAVNEDWKEVMLVPMPLFHIMGVYGTFTSYVINHITQVLITDPRDTKSLILTIRKHGITLLNLSPSLFIALLNNSERRPDDFKTVRLAIGGAAPLMTNTRERFQELIREDGIIGEGYSLTEACYALTLSPAKGAWKEGSVGVPLPDIVIRIVDVETGKVEKKPGQEGEVLFKAPQLMQGYWNRPEETAEVLRNGWLYTGDIGYLDDDGYLFLTSRKKDLIKPGGFQVWPREVEEILGTHPAIADVCVAGISDPRQGEAVKAWVVLKPGQAVTPEELQKHCREKLVAYKVPRFVEFRQDLPKTLVGKVLRRVLQEEEKVKQAATQAG